MAIDSAECIRCHDCKNACPHGAISSGWKKLKPMSAPACSACHGCSSNG
ncbi:4Fe-4S binding protein [Treponema lecithinolyticum]